jgi:hypothetical protein
VERETGALHPSVIGKELRLPLQGKIDQTDTQRWGGFSWQQTTVPPRATAGRKSFAPPVQRDRSDLAMMIGGDRRHDGTGRNP